MSYLENRQAELSQKESEQFADWFDDWKDALFGDWLERSVSGYADLIELLGTAGEDLPETVDGITKEQYDILYNLAQSQESVWKKFEDWAYDGWARE